MSINCENGPLESVVCEMIARACNFQHAVVSPNDSVYDLGLDSMSVTSVLAELETLYGVEFSADQIMEILQAPLVRDLIEVVSQVLQGESLSSASLA